MYNLDEMESEIIFYKTTKKNFFPTYSVLEKRAYHLIVAISVELPKYHLKFQTFLEFFKFLNILLKFFTNFLRFPSNFLKNYLFKFSMNFFHFGSLIFQIFQPTLSGYFRKNDIPTKQIPFVQHLEGGQGPPTTHRPTKARIFHAKRSLGRFSNADQPSSFQKRFKK